MSAQHIYHTALPLSPRASTLRERFFRNHPSWEEDLTTQQVSSQSLPATWGAVLRTIKADLGGFTHVAVAGQRIAAICEDNTVNVYDAVTGVLKLSLNTPRQVTKAEGSPDGSVLFCAHQSTREITLWDMQTGGLVHTLTTAFEISDIAVSLNGKYLASCSSDGTFRFWEVETRCGGSRFFDQPVMCICWLEPEDQVAIALKGTVMVLEMATGRTLHTVSVGGDVQGITFSAGQRRLAVWSAFGIENTIAIVDTHTGLTHFSSPPLTDVSCFTFSDNGYRVVCATRAGELLSFYPDEFSSSWDDYLSHLETIHCIGLLRSGHLVANVGGSIQILETEYARPSGTSLDSEISRVYPLDNGRAISASSRDRKGINLLDTETMKNLANHHGGFGYRDLSFTPRFLYASIDRRLAVLCVRDFDGFALKLHPIGHDVPGWEQFLERPALLGALSPNGEKFVIVMEHEVPGGVGWTLYLRTTSDGKVCTLVTWADRPPRNIAFTSETQFYIEYDDEGYYKEDCPVRESVIQGSSFQKFGTLVIPSRTSGVRFRTEDYHVDCHIRKRFYLIPTEWGLYTRELPEEKILSAHAYKLDKDLEWVVDAKSRRVCWLPPGYISGIENGHFFVGSSIVMAGKDGIVRKLTFRKPRSDS